MDFPASREEAVMRTRQPQARISKEWHDLYMTEAIDEENDRPPETAFIAAEIGKTTVRIVSYGDCRLLIGVPGHEVKYKHPMVSSWLGAFSMRGLRQRLPVEKGTVYSVQPFSHEDLLLLYTDGVDEAVYETPTLSDHDILECFPGRTLEHGSYALMLKVFNASAEDHTSFIAYQQPKERTVNT